jgi:hypothetical protein
MAFEATLLCSFMAILYLYPLEQHIRYIRDVKLLFLYHRFTFHCAIVHHIQCLVSQGAT